jgi:hypothetical protein
MLSCLDLARNFASEEFDLQLIGSLRWRVPSHRMMRGHGRRFIYQ